MAGNTKLKGFLPGNSVQIERWGKAVAVALTKESMFNLRSACLELPTSPPEQKNDDDGFRARYDESVGRVHVDMDPAVAEAVAQRLSAAAKTLSLLDEEAAERTASWVHHLRAAVQAHKDFHDVQGEPGVQDIR